MTRFLGLLSVCLLCSSLVACGDDEEQITITLFRGAPDAIELGESTKLVFAVTPKNVTVSIAEIGDVTGKTEATVSPTATTTYHLTATNGTSTATSTANVTVGPVTAAAIKVEPASATSTAGDSLSVTVSAIVASGTTAPGFRGTVRLTSSDAQAVLPPDIVFAAADAGVKQVKVTLKTAGLSTLTGTDVASPTRRGVGSLTVLPAAAATCAVSQAPPTAAAGALVGVTILLRDPFDNVATGYAGTIRLTASDARAILPADVTYVPTSDAGSHAFSASLLTAGVQTLSATDTVNAAIHCDTAILIAPSTRKIVLTLPGDANAGYSVNIGVAVKDVFDNPVPDYTGTVHFTSSDAGAGATVPADITFTGSEGGVATTSATFVTLGAQLLNASDAGTPLATGTAASNVHGLVYTAPTSGRVRLVARAAQSNTQIVQLDLVANERLEMSSFFNQGGVPGGPGSFATGMNLPLDTTRVTGDTTLFTVGPALPAGTGTPAAMARIGADDHVLYTAVSRKRVATATVFRQATEVQAGGVFYSVRLKLTQNGTVGPVFDGAQPGPLFRAAIRDQFGDDFVSQAEFGIGRLEIR